ncbi:MAG: PAS domain S-box protein, partial [Anaerolineales bacterium]
METHAQLEEAFSELAEIVGFTGQLSAKLHGLVDEGEILGALTKHFARSKKYTATVLLLTEDRSSLRIARTSLARRDLRAGEQAAGVRADGYEISLTKSHIYRRVVEEETTVVVSVDQIMAELLPGPVAKLLTKVLGYENRQSVLTPLRRRGELIGVLATSAPRLPEYFVPTVENLAHHVSTALDLADQYADARQATEELRASEAQYRALFEQAAESIVLADADSGAIVEFNDRAHENLGYTREELARLNVLDCLDADSVNTVLNEGADTLETRCRVKGGDWVDVLVSSRQISIGGRAFVQMTWRDITARKEAREALRQSEARYRSLITNIPDVVWT